MSKKIRRRIVALLSVVSIAGAALSLTAYTRAQKKASPTPSEKDAREAIRRFAGIELPSNAVTVKDVSSFGSAAVVVAQIETAFRLARGENGKWTVVEVRAGDNRWESVELLTRALDGEKSARARAELELLAAALETYRRERDAYVTGETVNALIDQLNPRYLTSYLYFDPWHRPYRYEGDAARYSIISDGPDRKSRTADDIARNGGS